jgi:actin-related protein
LNQASLPTKAAVVIDNDFDRYNTGIAGEDQSKSVFPAVIGATKQRARLCFHQAAIEVGSAPPQPYRITISHAIVSKQNMISCVNAFLLRELWSALDRKTLHVGKSAMARRGVPQIKCPLEHGIVTNWDHMKKIWHHTFVYERHVTNRSIPSSSPRHRSVPRPAASA